MAAPASAAVTSKLPGFSASGFGTYVTVGSVVTSGRTAVATLPCLATPGDDGSNTTAGVNIPGVLTAGATNTTADAAHSGGTYSATGTSTTAGVNLLGGAVTASAVTASAATSLAGGTYSNAGRSTFAGLSIGGQHITADPAPNTRIALPGFGYVTLNQQFPATTSSSASLTVFGLDVVITVKNAVEPVGAQLIVGGASSGLTSPATPLFNGAAFGTLASVGNTVVSGPTAVELTGCTGTNGVVKTNSTAGVNVPGVLSSGTITSTAEGDATGGTVNVNTSDTVEGANLLSALLTATTIRAEAHATQSGGTVTTSTTGSQFVGLHVSGFPAIGDQPAPNTRLTIAGVGTLWLNRVIPQPDGTLIRMVELDVTGSGLPLAPGALVIISQAYAQVR